MNSILPSIGANALRNQAAITHSLPRPFLQSRKDDTATLSKPEFTSRETVNAPPFHDDFVSVCKEVETVLAGFGEDVSF